MIELKIPADGSDDYSGLVPLRAHARAQEGKIGTSVSTVRMFRGDPPAIERERANQLRGKLMRLVEYRDPYSAIWAEGKPTWGAWWPMGPNDKHHPASERLDDWFTALACQQHAEAITIAREVARDWAERTHAWVARELRLMVEHQQKPTVGWVARIAAKLAMPGKAG